MSLIESQLQVRFAIVADHPDGRRVRASVVIDNVPYHGSGGDAVAALSHLLSTIRAHGAPMPDALSLGAM